MPIVTADQPLRHRWPIIYIYGEPGSSKSSLINTCENPILLDFDRGADRAILRKVVLQPDDWEEVKRLENSGEFKKYQTIGVDTAKGALDDFIQPWIIKQDPKYNTIKWQRQLYGEMGKEFKRFINNRRSQNCAVLVIAHARKEEDGKIVPDVTGGSAAFLLRLSDMVGYMSVKKGKRVIQFEPTEETYGKNCANLPLVEVPDKDSPEYRTFGAWLVKQVYDAINSMSVEQQAAIDKANEIQELLEACEDPDTLTAILKDVNTLPDHLKLPARKLISEKAKAMKWIVDKAKGSFALPPAEGKKEDPKEEAPAADKKRDKDGLLKGPGKFDEEYTDPMLLALCIDKITTPIHYNALELANHDMIEGDPDLKAKFEAKKKALENAKS